MVCPQLQGANHCQRVSCWCFEHGITSNRTQKILRVWAAEEIEKKHENFDLSESRSSGFSEIGKGSSTPEIA
jgi:hypothetical protein